MTYTDTFSQQAIAKELADLNQRVWAVEHLYDEARALLTAARVEAKLQQKTLDLLSERLDKVLEFIQLGEGGLDTWEKSDDD